MWPIRTYYHDCVCCEKKKISCLCCHGMMKMKNCCSPFAPSFHSSSSYLCSLISAVAVSCSSCEIQGRVEDHTHLQPMTHSAFSRGLPYFSRLPFMAGMTVTAVICSWEYKKHKSEAANMYRETQIKSLHYCIRKLILSNY